ncbi:MAG: ABC transporter ATP-binding protein [Infirmifilum sp.]|jgi:peptide/nickel transport system ATP-binding protein|uniref:ABC transporter ATP-binding protein n=1 Tax=Infirmifilum TaxID=2856573 RepID=UPI003C73CE11
MTLNGKILLELDNVRAYYYITHRGVERAVKAVDGVSLKVYNGEILGIIGESGSGKSTLAEVMMMNIRPPLRFLEGKVTFHDEEEGIIELSTKTYEYLQNHVFGSRIAIAPQTAMVALPPAHKLWKIARDIFESHGIVKTKEEVVAHLSEIFEKLKLPPETLNKYFFELSGGMKQRVVLAMSSLLNPDILIADEIIAALDVVVAKTVLETLKQIRDVGLVSSVVFISHDVPAVFEVADRIAVMYAGKIVEIGPSAEIARNPLHPYTRLLLESLVTIEKGVERGKLKWVPGEFPDLSNPPPGCRFHPRCPFARSVCREVIPELVEVRPNHYVACLMYGERYGSSS